jgi:thiamine monophosphate kinase
MHLYCAFLGGELAANRMGEDHEVVFVVAEDTASARQAAMKKWAAMVGAMSTP